jgi:Glycosyltransferase family 6
MDTSLIFICTGKDYWKFIRPAIDSTKQFFPSDAILFTDCLEKFDVARQVQISHAGWPNATLMRYHTMLGEREWLSQHKHVFYLDIDMLVVDQIGDEILSDGITACVHAAFETSGAKYCTPEENPRSTACLSKKDIRKMYTGCFVGGETKAFLAMAETISKNIDIDNANNFIATWHDESHLNRYLYDNPPAKELFQDYNAWDKKPTTKIFRVPKPGALDRPAVNGKQPWDIRNLPS